MVTALAQILLSLAYFMIIASKPFPDQSLNLNLWQRSLVSSFKFICLLSQEQIIHFIQFENVFCGKTTTIKTTPFL